MIVSKLDILLFFYDVLFLFSNEFDGRIYVF